jgi:hypothetical protein
MAMSGSTLGVFRMVKMEITVDDELLKAVTDRLAALNSAQSMPATAAAMKSAAAVVKAVWQGYATGANTLPGVPPMKSPSGGYARGISIKSNGPFDYSVVNPSDIADYIENGTSEIDMKETHTRGPRSRVSKKGVPYLIIPFRWKTPNTLGHRNIMPAEIYAIVKKAKFERSVVDEGTHNDPNAQGENVDRWNYKKWGSRLGMNQIIRADDGSMSINNIFNMNGMVSMDTSSINKKYSGYYTFRVISANSPPGSWIKPATPARNVTEGVKRAAQDDVSAIFESAFKKDLGL